MINSISQYLSQILLVGIKSSNGKGLTVFIVIR